MSKEEPCGFSICSNCTEQGCTDPSVTPDNNKGTCDFYRTKEEWEEYLEKHGEWIDGNLSF